MLIGRQIRKARNDPYGLVEALLEVAAGLGQDEFLGPPVSDHRTSLDDTARLESIDDATGGDPQDFGPLILARSETGDVLSIDPQRYWEGVADWFRSRGDDPHRFKGHGGSGQQRTPLDGRRSVASSP